SCSGRRRRRCLLPPCCRCSIVRAARRGASARASPWYASGWALPVPPTGWRGSRWSCWGEAALGRTPGRETRRGARWPPGRDVPRGPAEHVKPGALAAAQHAAALVIAVGARASSAWWIRSWDRFCLPKPFATIDVVYSAPFTVAAGKDGLRQGIADAERALAEVTYGGKGEGGRA